MFPRRNDRLQPDITFRRNEHGHRKRTIWRCMADLPVLYYHRPDGILVYRNCCLSLVLLLMEEILHQLRLVVYPHYLQRFCHIPGGPLVLYIPPIFGWFNPKKPQYLRSFSECLWGHKPSHFLLGPGKLSSWTTPFSAPTLWTFIGCSSLDICPQYRLNKKQQPIKSYGEQKP